MARRNAKNDEGILEVALKGSWKLSASLAAMLSVFTFLIAPLFSGTVFKIIFQVLTPFTTLFIWVFGLIAVFKVLHQLSDSIADSDNRGIFEPRSTYSLAEAQNRALADASVLSAKPEWSLALLRQIEWKLFEDLSAAYYREKGIQAETTSLGADGGIDIKLYQDESGSPTSLVQCKAWSRQVGVREMREFLGVLSHEKIGKGFYMTSASFTEDAKNFAGDHGITLITGEMLLMMIQRLPEESQQKLLRMITCGDYTTPTCPNCGVKMVKRSSKRGEFWGCRNYPRCRRILNVPRAETVRKQPNLLY